MSLANLIQQHAAALAATSDWAGVAAAMSAKTITVPLGKVGGKESLAALLAAGQDPNAVITAMRAVPVASVLLDTLISSGVDWSDPLTVQIMTGLANVGLITPAVVTAMRSLSERIDSLAGRTVTAAECQAAVSQARLAADWATVQNNHINAATGTREQLIAGLTAAAEALRVV